MENSEKNYFTLQAKTDSKIYFITKDNFLKCVRDFKICKKFYETKFNIDYHNLNVN